eukprot:5887340-Pyramimonas_sp.AAC.1
MAMAPAVVGWLCLGLCIVRCVQSSQLDYGALLQKRPEVDAQHLYLVPPECKWDGRGKEPKCDGSMPATQRLMARYFRPQYPTDFL